jgi:hypothetical protein
MNPPDPWFSGFIPGPAVLAVAALLLEIWPERNAEAPW